MSRLVIAYVEDRQAKVVEKVLRDACDASPMMGPIDDFDGLADAVRDGTNVEHDLHVVASMHSHGNPLSVPAGNPLLDEPLQALRAQLGDDMEVVRVTIIVEGRAQS